MLMLSLGTFYCKVDCSSLVTIGMPREATAQAIIGPLWSTRTVPEVFIFRNYDVRLKEILWPSANFLCQPTPV